METSGVQEHIGLLFGSCNPPHLAHVEKAKRMKEAGRLTEVWMMPIPQSPYKKDIDQVPFEGKVEMCRIITEPYSDWLKVSDACANFPPNKIGQLQQYKRTIEQFFNDKSGAKFSIVAGEDFSKKYNDVVSGMAFLSMMVEACKSMSIFKMATINEFADRVLRANEVFQKLDVLSAERETLVVPTEDGQAVQQIEISSKDIREAIRSGADHIAGIPERLMEHIMQRGFYSAPRVH